MAGRINIIGCGRAAGSLARLWVQANSLGIGDVINRSEASTREAVRKIGAGNGVKSISEMETADFWLIGTSAPDNPDPDSIDLTDKSLADDDNTVFTDPVILGVTKTTRDYKQDHF